MFPLEQPSPSNSSFPPFNSTADLTPPVPPLSLVGTEGLGWERICVRTLRGLCRALPGESFYSGQACRAFPASGFPPFTSLAQAQSLPSSRTGLLAALKLMLFSSPYFQGPAKRPPPPWSLL